MSLLLLVSPSGQGKTTVCSKAVELARNSGLRVSGILSLPVYQDKVKVAIALRDIATGQERILARASQEGNGPLIGIWRFDRQSLDWGQQVLASLPSSDLLVLDEIGPLEIEMGQGLTNALGALRGKDYHLALVTLRPSLVERILAKFIGFDISIRVLDEQNRNTEPESIVAEAIKLRTENLNLKGNPK